MMTMPWVVKGNCVHKKNDDGSTGPVVKCHGNREEAVAHLRALYKNVPDAPKYSEFFVPFSRYDDPPLKKQGK